MWPLHVINEVTFINLTMTKKKILLLIPLAIIAGLLIYCWIAILTKDYTVRWQHVSAIVLFAGVVFIYFKNITKAIISTGAFLLLGTCNAFSMTPDINTTWFRVGPLETPPFNFLSFGLLILFLILNFDTMVNLYLDYKEAKQTNQKN